MDPIGQAIYNYYFNHDSEKLLVESNYTEGEEISPDHFFRSYDEMPEIEKHALGLCQGKVLDVGAGAGCHSIELINRGFDVVSLEKSQLAATVIKHRGVQNVVVGDIYKFQTEGFDTILFLMNGAGIAGTLRGLKKLLKIIKPLLNPYGHIIIDSVDINYLFYEDDGSYWIDIANKEYYGEMTYKVSYKNTIKTTFPWLYIDQEMLSKIAFSQGFKAEIIHQDDNFCYLSRLTIV